jgi:hypothetical protein
MFQPPTQIVQTMAARNTCVSIVLRFFFGMESGCPVRVPLRSNMLRTQGVVEEVLFLCPCIGLFLSLSVDGLGMEEVDVTQTSCV